MADLYTSKDCKGYTASPTIKIKVKRTKPLTRKESRTIKKIRKMADKLQEKNINLEISVKLDGNEVV